MISDSPEADGLGCFLYRSTAHDALRADCFEAILSVARRRNRDSNLTGCLHYEDGLFFQWLEGPQGQLRSIVTSILEDDRHRDITVLSDGRLDRRRFQDWRMRFSDRDHASLLDWLAGSGVTTIHRRDYANSVTEFLQSVSV